MLLVVNGCSHSTGAEIEETKSSSCYEKAWPTLLATLLDCEIINLARSGGSSKRVTRTTINWLGANYKKKLHNNMIFIALWPGISRTEIKTNNQLYDTENNSDQIYEEDGKWMILNVGNVESYEEAVKDGWFPKPILQYYKHWLTVITQEELWEQQYLNILSLQGMLKSLGISYLFQNSVSGLNVTGASNKRLYPLVDKKHFPGCDNYHVSYDGLLKSQGFSYAPWSTGHFGEEGHAWYAKYMYQMIKSKYPHLTSATE